MFQVELLVEDGVGLKAVLEIFLDEEVAIGRENLDGFFLAVLVVFVITLLEQQLVHVLVLVSVVVHHLEVQNAENANLLIELGVDEAMNIYQKQSS